MLSINRTVSDPRKGRAKRIITILALAAAAGAARAQTTTNPQLPTAATTGDAIASALTGLVAPPLEKVTTLTDIATDEAQLLPCTIADVAGEFARLAQTGVLKMEALPCEPWVRLTIADAYGDNEAEARRAGAGRDATMAFSLSPQEAEALRSSGVASGQAVPLNSLVSAVALGPRTPGFGGSLGRVSRRTGETLEAAAADVLSSLPGAAAQKARSEALYEDARLVDGGRAFPAQALYEPLALSPGAVPAAVQNLDPNGAIVILTAAQPGVPLRPGGGEAVPRNPVSVDATAGPGKDPTLLVSDAGKLIPLPNEQMVLRAPVGGDPSLPVTVVTSGSAAKSLEAEGAEGGRRRR